MGQSIGIWQFILRLVHMLFPGSKSNREKGVGRYDIYVPVIERKCAIIEIKKADEKELGRSVEAALQQIKDKSYQAGLEGDIWLIGIAFSRKSFEIRHEKRKKVWNESLGSIFIGWKCLGVTVREKREFYCRWNGPIQMIQTLSR